MKWHETQVGEDSGSQTPKIHQKQNKFLDDQNFDPQNSQFFGRFYGVPFFVLFFFFQSLRSPILIPYYAPCYSTFTYICHKFMINVGKYSSPMEHLGIWPRFDRSPFRTHRWMWKIPPKKVMLMSAVANGNIPGVHDSLGQRCLAFLADRWGPEALDIGICLFRWRNSDVLFYFYRKKHW